MSGPNTNDDPVATSALDAAQVERHVTEALAAIAQASTTAELKDVRIAHVGDHSPLALANREIGSLPPAERRQVGKRVGMARGRVKQALAARTAEV
ncbi:MAG: phenylalanine--tRNA ligase subunit alpha, partial [Acidipropionibacterium jensenii]|nr:phenylalanine--tRNA ligase subunit alpha [Acidipropionibacterium jensenii]